LSLIHALNTAPQKPGIKSQIITEAHIFEPGMANSYPPHRTQNSLLVALWDTGATNTVICKSVTQTMNLRSMGVRNMHTANGPTVANVYLVDFVLPNKVLLESMQVTESDFTMNIPLFHILIGMDIINLGDFSITNYKGNTVMNFRLPSIEERDFVSHASKHNSAVLKKQRRETLSSSGKRPIKR
jgi:predicted aspartyl protease